MKKTISLMLALMMMLSLAIPAFAADVTETIEFSAFDGSIIMPKTAITVKDGVAESFGYTVKSVDHNGEAVDDITALDALVAAHKAYYGDAFTKDTATNYLSVVSGQVVLAFGKNARASGFAIDNECPHDDNFNALWNSYTGYSIDEAELDDGDTMSFFFYQDTMMYSDHFAWFEDATGDDVDDIEGKIGTEVTLKLVGFCFGWYSCSRDEDKGIIPLAGVDVYAYANGEYTKIGTTDENGLITIKIAEGKSYSIVAYGTSVDAYESDVPVVAAWADVEVKPFSFFEKIINFIMQLIAKIKALFVR